MNGCGGCEGKGAHSRPCRDPLGYLADLVEDIGDEVASANMALTNKAYQIATDLRHLGRIYCPVITTFPSDFEKQVKR